MFIYYRYESIFLLHIYLIQVDHVARMEDMKNVYKVWPGNLKGSLGISMHRWEDNIRTDLREIGWKGVQWMHMAQDKD